MRTLKIGLRDGFAHDEVTIAVNGKVTRRESNVTSNPVVSFARDISIELPDEPATVRVDVSSRKLSTSTQVDRQTVYLAVFLLHGRLDLRPLNEELPVM